MLKQRPDAETSDGDVSYISEEIATGIRRAIFLGEVEPGAEIPSLRTISAETGHSVNMVRSVCQRLVDEGLLTKGKLTGRYRVISSPDQIADIRLRRLNGDYRTFAQKAMALGYAVTAQPTVLGDTTGDTKK